MKAASRLADCLLKDLSQFDIPLTPECAELAHFAATYMWYGCCGGKNPTPQDGIEADLSQKDSELFGCCCQYLEILVLGRKEPANVPKHLAIILNSFRKPLTSARWKVVSERIQKVLQLIVSCIEATKSADADSRLTLACCQTESVAVFLLNTLQKSGIAENIVQDLLALLESSILSDFIEQSDLDGLKLVGSILLSFVKSMAGTKLSKEKTAFGADIVKECLSSLNSRLQESKSIFGNIQFVTARVVLTCVESLITLLLGKKEGDILSAEGLQIAVALYTCQLELIEEVLQQHSQIPSENDSICSVLCIKRDVWFRKLQLINTHLHKNSSSVTGMYSQYLCYSLTVIDL